MTALLERDHHLARAGQVILADKGFADWEFEAFAGDCSSGAGYVPGPGGSNLMGGVHSQFSVLTVAGK